MKIIIIGAKGMLGQALKDVFAEGNELFLWDKDEIDITDSEIVRSRLLGAKPDLVINSAAFNDVDGAETKPEVANAVNASGVGFIAKSCAQLEIPVVHYSTNYVFDGGNKEGYAEDAQPKPISKYGESKFLGEQELQRNTDKFYLIRTARLFGAESSSALAKKSFVNLMLNLAATKDTLEVVDEELSNSTYVLDLAAQTKYIATNNLPFGIYHVANAGSCTWFGFAQEIFKIKSIDVKLLPVPGSRFPRPAKRPAYAVLINTKLPGLRSWQEALKEFLNFTNN